MTMCSPIIIMFVTLFLSVVSVFFVSSLSYFLVPRASFGVSSIQVDVTSSVGFAVVVALLISRLRGRARPSYVSLPLMKAVRSGKV